MVEASAEDLGDRGQVRAVDDTVAEFAAESAAEERCHDQVQVHVVLAVVPRAVEPHPKLIFALLWVPLAQKSAADLLHVTEKLQVGRWLPSVGLL